MDLGGAGVRGGEAERRAAEEEEEEQLGRKEFERAISEQFKELNFVDVDDFTSNDEQGKYLGLTPPRPHPPHPEPPTSCLVTSLDNPTVTQNCYHKLQATLLIITLCLTRTIFASKYNIFTIFVYCDI